jgi:TIG domain-containing protein
MADGGEEVTALAGLRQAAAIVSLALAARDGGKDLIAPAAPEPIPGRKVERFAERIDALYPSNAYAGVPFAIRFDGASVMGIAGEGFSPASTVYFADTPLATDFGSSRSLTATVPTELISHAGVFGVSVHDPAGGKSPEFRFVVLPPRPGGACPAIRRLFPTGTTAGVSFATRPDGASNLGVAGENFGPGSKIVLGAVELKTTYQGPGSAVAVVPRGMLARKRKFLVTIRDPDCGRASAPVVFEVR